MLLPVLLLALVICGALIFGVALSVTRRKRLELEQRLSLLPLASESVEPEVASGSSEKPEAGFLKLERLLFLSSDHPWKLEADSGKLAIFTIVAAAFTWFAFHSLIRAPFAFSAVATCLGAYFGLRVAVIRERTRMELAFSTLFPDSVDAVGRMLRAGLPVTSAFQLEIHAAQDAPSQRDPHQKLSNVARRDEKRYRGHQLCISAGDGLATTEDAQRQKDKRARHKAEADLSGTHCKA
jgi:Flp pilus assembly protein TadB